MQMEIRFKNVAFLASRMSASPMIRVFPSLSIPRVMSASRKTLWWTFVPSLTCTPAIKYNRAKLISESSSALTLIADDDEFRFARFYIVYEGVQLGG